MKPCLVFSRWPLTVVFATNLILPLAFAAAEKRQSPDRSRLSRQIESQLYRRGTADVLVYFHQDPARYVTQHRPLDLVVTHASRVAFVYRELQLQAESQQRDVLQYLTANKVPHSSFFILNVIHLPEANRKTLDWILQQPEVRKIALNPRTRMISAREVRRDFNPSSRPRKIEAGLRLIQADRVWSELGVRGKGIVIGSTDGGADWTHPALRRQYRGFSPLFVKHDYHWHDAIRTGGTPGCPARSPEPCDETSHGTHTIGTMVGDDGQGQQIGVAPEAQWIACRNMDRGRGTLTTYLECLEFMMAPYPYGGNSKDDGRPEFAPHIINNSWSCPRSEGCDPDDLLPAFQALRAAGILVVAAAGNNGSSCGSLQNPPGTYSGDLISVAAYNRYLNEAAYFSNRGPSSFTGRVGLDVTAPGVGVRSAERGGSYKELDGTSMAAPHVAGSLALLLSYRPSLIGRWDQTVNLLHSSAQPMTSKENCAGFSGQRIPNATHGHGLLNAYQLLKKSEIAH